MLLSPNEVRRLEGLSPYEFHKRYHARLFDYAYAECPGWPCRMRTLRGRAREWWTTFLVATKLFRIRDWWWDRGGKEGR